MYGVISGLVFSDDILQSLDSEPIFFVKGDFSEEEFIQNCSNASRVHIDTLIVDLDSCQDEDAVVRGIRQFKITRPKSRIIIIGVDRQTGNKQISDLVSLNVYDIVAPEIPHDESDEEDTLVFDLRPYILERLNTPSTYADVARWHYLNEDGLHHKNKSKTKVKKIIEKQIEERIVVKEKFVNTVVIAVSGIGPRTGSTHAAIQIANYLANNSYKIACVEYLDEIKGKPVFKLFDNETKSKLNPEGFRLKKVDFFYKRDQLLNVLNAGYDYVVMDLGEILDNYEETNLTQEFLRADLQILTTGTSIWDFDRLITFLEKKSELNWGPTVNVLFNFADEESFKESCKAYTNSELKELRVSFYKNEMNTEPFNTLPDSELFTNLLKNVLPKEHGNKRKGLFSKVLQKK